MIGLLSQNACGFGRTEEDIAIWFSSFHRTHDHGHFDAVLLQETHVAAEDSHLMMQPHAQQWGYRVGEGCPQLSFWSAGSSRSAGVGILVHPQTRFQEVQPVLQNKWSPHFIAVQTKREGPRYTCSIYTHRRMLLRMRDSTKIYRQSRHPRIHNFTLVVILTVRNMEPKVGPMPRTLPTMCQRHWSVSSIFGDFMTACPMSCQPRMISKACRGSVICITRTRTRYRTVVWPQVDWIGGMQMTLHGPGWRAPKRTFTESSRTIVVF